MPAKRAGISISWRFLITFLLVIFFDQATKLAVMHLLPWIDGEPIYSFASANPPVTVINNFFYIVHITNEGAAWGILSGRTYLLASIAIVTLAGMWYFRKDMGFDIPQMQVAVGLFAGGVIGNLIDRVCYGHVVDFLDVHLPFINYRWPAFNIADCAITAGVALYIIFTLALERRQKRELKKGSQNSDS